MKKVLISCISLITLFIPLNKVLAGASISTNATSIYVGNSVTASITITEAAAWEVHIGVSGAASPSNCSGLDFADSTNDTLNTTRTYAVTCTPTKTGTITFVINNNSNITNQDGVTSYLSGSTSVSVINKPVVQQPQTPVTTPKPSTNTTTITPKSSVNYLSSLTVEGKEISPTFNKETLEYTVELESGTTAININATAEHNKASITGHGVKSVTEGVNNFDIVVTAENGSKRTYKLKAIVKEKDPILVYIDNKEYTVIRKKEQLPQSSAFYSESNVTINNEEIPSYFGEVTGYTLVGLKNSEGIINLFTYDEDNNSYKLYQEFNFSRVVFYPIEPEEEIIPEGFNKYLVTINGIEISCYKKSEKDDLILLYGVNIENNNEGFYIYDSLENTLQRYDDTIFDSYKEEILILKSVIFGLVSIVLVVVIVAALQGSINKNNKKLKSVSLPKQKEEKIKVQKETNKENKREAKLLEKELKRKEKEEKKKHKKSLEDTNMIDITSINIKKKDK